MAKAEVGVQRSSMAHHLTRLQAHAELEGLAVSAVVDHFPIRQRHSEVHQCDVSRVALLSCGQRAAEHLLLEARRQRRAILVGQAHADLRVEAAVRARE